MTTPAAPTEGGGSKILFLVYDNASTNAAALMRAFKEETINAEVYGDLGVYPTSGTLENGGQSVASGGTAEVLGASTPCQGVLIKADPANTSTVYIGKSDVTGDYADTTGGYPLSPGESVGVPCRNITEVYILSATTGDKVAWIASAD